MGIPRFYRWLSERYPLINEKLLASVNAAGNTSSDNLRSLYPHAPHLYEYLEMVQLSSTSSFHVDCLYLDLNGILHNSTHANSTTGNLMVEHRYEEVWLNVMGYIGRIVEIARPRRLLYIAVDGVAPRAKMNQQRARRFRSAEERKMRREAKSERSSVDPSIFGEAHLSETYADSIDFDSNCITPGTQFMCELQHHLDFFVSKQMAENAIWKNLEVILSGPNVPGEGEHKIAEFIRSMRTQPGYPSNLSHCIHGLDADLVMLSLMSHEPLFTLLREEVVLDQEPRWITDQRKLISRTDSFQLLHICLLREYLALDVLSNVMARIPRGSNKAKSRNPYREMENDGPRILSKDNKSFHELLMSKPCRAILDSIHFDVERVINDFILFCCLAGNDFLPHLAFADIGSNGLDKMLNVYVDHLVSFSKLLKKEGGAVNGITTPWLLEEGGQICWSNLLLFLESCCTELEDELLQDKFESAQWLQEKMQHPLKIPDSDLTLDETLDETTSSGFDGGPGLDRWYARGRTIESIDDHIAFHYWRKMQFDIQDGTEESLAMRDRLVLSYLEGLQWTMLYYFDGVPSWSWYYPFHYAPFARDVVRYLKDQSYDFKITFELGKPFHPFQQLMAVLPPLSADLVPAIYRPLMQSTSNVHDFYPEVFGVDREGVKVSWGGVTLLPFIDEDRLLLAMERIDGGGSKLSSAERARAAEGILYIYRREKLIKPFLLMTLATAGFIATPGKRSVVPSTLPSYFRDIVDPGVPLRYSLPFSTFSFRRIQRGLHQSAVVSGYSQPSYQPTFLTWSETSYLEANLAGDVAPEGYKGACCPNCLDELAKGIKATASDADEPAWATSPIASALCRTQRINSILRQKDIVRAFYRVTRNPSIIVTLEPSLMSNADPDPENAVCLGVNHLAHVLMRIKDGLGSQLDFDFSYLPTVRCSYPYRHVGKLIGVYMDSIGYVPLHQKSKSIDVNFQDFFLNEMRGTINRGWKLNKDQFNLVRNNLYHLFIRRGLKLKQEECITIDEGTRDVIEDLERVLLQIVSIFSGRDIRRPHVQRDVFNWKELVLEILDIEEVAENLASKPLLRYKQNQSRLCFYSEIEILHDTATTDQFHQALDSHIASIGDTVMCSAETPFFGNVGVVAESTGTTLLSQFDVKESAEDRYEYQKQLVGAYADIYKREQWYTINELAKQLKKPVRTLRCILRKLPVRTTDSAWRDIVDMGLGLIQETKNPVDGTMTPVCVPGYSYLDDNGQYHFSEEVVGIIKKYLQIWPRLEKCISKHGEGDKVTLSDFFGEDCNISEMDKQVCLRLYLKWLNSQPFKTVGTSFADYDCVPLSAIKRILESVSNQSTKLSSIVPEVFWVKGYQNVLRELHSPVVPIKKIKLLCLGQRVVVVKSGSLAVYGSRGVIVALFPGTSENNEGELLAEVICENPVVGGQSCFGRFDSVSRRIRIPCRCLLPIPPIAHFARVPPKGAFLEHSASVLKQCVHRPNRKLLETCWQGFQ